MNLIEFIKKLQNLPVNQKKIILWTIVVLMGLLLGFLWLKMAKNRLERLDMDTFIKQLNIPSFEKEKLEWESFKEQRKEQIEGIKEELEEESEEELEEELEASEDRETKKF